MAGDPVGQEETTGAGSDEDSESLPLIDSADSQFHATSGELPKDHRSNAKYNIFSRLCFWYVRVCMSIIMNKYKLAQEMAELYYILFR